MSDITGSTKVGDGVTISYDVNPSTQNPSATLTLSFEGIKLASATVNSTDATASIGGSYEGTGVKATIVANWVGKTITYSVTINPPIGKTLHYSGTVVSW